MRLYPSSSNKIGSMTASKNSSFSLSASIQHLKPKFWVLKLPPRWTVQVLWHSHTHFLTQKNEQKFHIFSIWWEGTMYFPGKLISQSFLVLRSKRSLSCHKWTYQDFFVIVIINLERYSCGQSSMHAFI